MNIKCILSIFALSVTHICAETPFKTQCDYYTHSIFGNIQEHLPTLANLTKECSSVAEIGVENMVSTWAFLHGLAQNDSPHRSYLGIDPFMPIASSFYQARDLCQQNGIEFNFILKNDLYVDLEPVDLLFIDSLHTYVHLTYELEKFSPSARKYIVMHDTSAPWGHQDEVPYYSFDTSLYPAHINREKRGLWQAVVDFLETHPEWTLHFRHENCHGLTVLRRVSS